MPQKSTRRTRLPQPVIRPTDVQYCTGGGDHDVVCWMFSLMKVQVTTLIPTNHIMAAEPGTQSITSG